MIERFATHRDEAGEAAFAVLVARHGPIVPAIGRQILGDSHQATDAFPPDRVGLLRESGWKA